MLLLQLGSRPQRLEELSSRPKDDRQRSLVPLRSDSCALEGSVGLPYRLPVVQKPDGIGRHQAPYYLTIKSVASLVPVRSRPTALRHYAAPCEVILMVLETWVLPLVALATGGI